MKVKSILLVGLICVVLPEGAAQERARVRSFQFRNLDLRAALDSLLRWYEVPVAYLEKDVAGKRVSTECSECNFEEALGKVIEGQALASKKLGEQVLLQKHEPQNVTFAGTIRDSLTGEEIAGADVVLLNQENPPKAYRWCTTSRFGFFSLRNLQPGNYVLNIRRIGYRTINEPVSIQPGDAVIRNFDFTSQELGHPEITVEGRRSAFTASEGISRGVYIRATPSDHNQYFLEGARVYNPLHFGGVMSTFNGDVLRDVQVLAGGVPPYYGGRIGGILDVSLRDGTGKGLSGSAGVGSLGSNLLLEGPVYDEMAFVISGRRGYPDVFFPRYGTDETPSDLNSSEVMAKVTHHLSGNQRLSLSGYFGQDTYGNQIADRGGNQLSNALRWGNATANLQWIGVASPALFFFASAVYTQYGFDVEHLLGRIDGSPTELLRETFRSNFLIQDAAVRAHAEYFYDEYHTVLTGVDLVRHRMTGRISEFSSQLAPMSLDGFAPWELSVYFQDQWRLAPSVLAEVGARATSFIAKQGSFSAVDPRFSLLVSLDDDLRLYSSFSAVNQFVHPYRHSGVFLFYPSIFLYPSTDEIRPSTSLQVSLGMQKSFDENRYTIAVESYYRTTQKLHEFVFDTTVVTTLPDALLLGEGNVYGADITFDRRIGDLTGSIRYSFSMASNRFAELNGGEPLRPRFDRRHELYAMVSYSPHENWTIGAVCLLSSNQFPSFASGGLKAHDVLATPASTVPERSHVQYSEPYDLNGGRLPGFQRLELHVMHRFSWFVMPFQATLRLLNGYGLIDPFVWRLQESSDNRLRWQATFDAPPILPLYPVVSVGVRF
jgi:hypothetical protein